MHVAKYKSGNSRYKLCTYILFYNKRGDYLTSLMEVTADRRSCHCTRGTRILWVGEPHNRTLAPLLMEMGAAAFYHTYQ